MSLLEVRDVSKRFKGLSALSNVSFDINGGEILGLIGPNGAGKTTLFNVITGFLSPDSGQVNLNGQNIVGLRPHQICKKGLVRTFQIVKPFHELSVLENVRAGAYNFVNTKKEATDIALELLEFVGLASRKDDLAKVLTISELKRLELTRALATKPILCLLDEVMSGLNPREVDDMLVVINKVKTARKIVLFIIEHTMRAIMTIFDRIIVLDRGIKLSEGRPSEVASDSKVIEAYLGGEEV